jgi:DtxR family Mn-dependent transcriptional regulator
MPHLAAEDYLADIYRLETEGLSATTGAVAERRSVSPASATAMFKRLARDGLVTYREYEGVILTEEGQRVALGVLRRHRLVERFLTDLLRLPWDQVDGIADQMEHALPDVVVDALETLLGSPFTCPHGYPIPDREGHLAEVALRRLADLAPGQSGRIARVDERIPGLLAYLDSVGMMLGAAVSVEGVNPVDDTMTLRVDGPAFVVGPRVTHAVSVAPTHRGGRGGPQAAPAPGGEAGTAVPDGR